MSTRKEGWLARQIHTEPAEGRKKGKEEFLTNLDEIRIALKTCSVHSTWQMLKAKNLYHGSYSSFWKHTKKYLSSPPPQEAPTQTASPAAQPEQVPREENRPREAARTPQFRFSKTPINSNGEPIR